MQLMTLKRKILARLDSLLPAETLVATHTSSISIAQLAAAGGRRLARRQRIVSRALRGRSLELAAVARPAPATIPA